MWPCASTLGVVDVVSCSLTLFLFEMFSESAELPLFWTEEDPHHACLRQPCLPLTGRCGVEDETASQRLPPLSLTSAWSDDGDVRCLARTLPARHVMSLVLVLVLVLVVLLLLLLLSLLLHSGCCFDS